MQSDLNNTEAAAEILKRHKFDDAGAFYPQIFVTTAVCFGSFSYGNILGWGGPALEHLQELHYTVVRPESDYSWVVSIAPLAAACGIFLWAFFNKRVGPKRTMLLQSPFLLLSWFLMAYYKHYKIYCSARFLSGFCAASYIYSGEILLIETVNRKHMKTLFTFFRASIILGILSMNLISTFFTRLWICVTCASITIISVLLTLFLHDSPAFLIIRSEVAAEKSLKYYSGKSSVAPELNVLRQYVKFLQFGTESERHMLSAKVVIRAIFITTMLQVFKTVTGYHAFLLDSVRIFTKSSALITPYVDNIIFGAVLTLANFTGTWIHLHRNYSVRKAMMTSLLLMALVMCSLGLVNYSEHLVRSLILVALCLHAVSYEVGMNIYPEIVLYHYVPFQVYDFLMKVEKAVHWFLVFIMVQLYMLCKLYFGLMVTLWVLSGVAMAGFFFVLLCVVETKGQSLMGIQLKLGGNPVGNRGSRRQRIANPFERRDEIYFLQDIIQHANQINARTSNASAL